MGLNKKSNDRSRQQKLERKRKKQKVAAKKERSFREQAAPEKRVISIVGSEACFTPCIYRELIVEGDANPDYELKIVGPDIGLWWFDKPEERKWRMNGEQVSVMTIASCVPQPKPVVHNELDWRVLCNAKYYTCTAYLIENLEKSSRYGKWLRLQKHQGRNTLDDSIEYDRTLFTFQLAVGIPPQKQFEMLNQIRHVSLPRLVRKCMNIIDIGLTGRHTAELSALQIDRVFEFFQKLCHIFPRLHEEFTHTPYQHAELERLQTRAEAEETAALGRLAAAVDAVTKATADLEKAEAAYGDVLRPLQQDSDERSAAQSAAEQKVDSAKARKVELERQFDEAKQNVIAYSATPNRDAARLAELQADAEGFPARIRQADADLRHANSQLRAAISRAELSARQLNFYSLTEKSKVTQAEAALKAATIGERKMSAEVDLWFRRRDEVVTMLTLEKVR